MGLLVTAFTFGLRHGFDWDHIAAIADLSGTADNRRRGFFLSMMYAVGHALVVFVLGTLAIIFGLAIPESVDTWMGRVVGFTLIALGLWILFELARKGRNFRLRSRWMLMIDGTFAGLRRVRTAATGRTIEVAHEHEHEHVDSYDDHQGQHAHDHAHLEPATIDLTAELTSGVTADVGGHPISDPASLTGASSVTTSEPMSRWQSVRQRLAHGHAHAHGDHEAHAHTHRHQLALPSTAEGRYSRGTATGIGMLHGIGIESPTQIAIFVASTTAAGVGFGLLLLSAWILGMLGANAVLAVLAGAGLLNAERSFPIYAALAIVVSVLSIGLGVVYVLGFDLLPSIFT